MGAPTKLPVIGYLNSAAAGSTYKGGGMQSQSLRLADKEKREWVIRSVEKSLMLCCPMNSGPHLPATGLMMPRVRNILFLH
jgi:hypothetical protein